MHPDVQTLIQRFNLQQHPEGGFYNEVFRSNATVLMPERFGEKKRSSKTVIYFLLPGDDFSSFHRFKSEETWHFFAGSTGAIYVINPNGSLSTHLIGNSLEDARADFQVEIPSNNWFAAEVMDKKSYLFVGCTVAPGFEFEDFELADRQLAKQYPEHETLINRLIRD